MSTDDFISRATKTVTKRLEVAEVDIEDRFCTYAKRKGCKALKLIFLNKKGFPDRTILCPGGRIFFIEFKRKGKTASPSQVNTRKLLVSFGFDYYICDVIGQAENHLDNFLDDF